MDNQHTKIKGYRDLSQGEIDLMNETKALAEKVGELVERLQRVGQLEGATPDFYLDQRWIAQGKTTLQNGFMQLIRGIAQPTTF